MPLITHDYEPLTDQQLEELSDRLPGWEIEEETLTQTFEFEDFNEAAEFVSGVVGIADELWHHPDISLHSFNQVTITLSTHDINGLSTLDVSVAEAIDQL
jgi:4a-hydroxytetrahydrobiopterin dehydratase